MDVLVARLPSTIGRWAWSEAMRQQKPVLIEFMACTWDALWYNSLKAKLPCTLLSVPEPSADAQGKATPFM